MERYKEPAKEIPVYGRYDVVVAGGGCAGFAAAVAAARTGAKTLIIEQFPFFWRNGNSLTDGDNRWREKSGEAG